MSRIMIAPGKQVQGHGEPKKQKDHLGGFGNKAHALISRGGLSRLEDTIRKSFSGSGSEPVFEVFGGECYREEIERIRKVCSEKDCDVIAGVGGGKILDTAKAVAFYEKKPVVIVPTIASIDD